MRRQLRLLPHWPPWRGRGEAPALAGTNFMNAWRGRTTKDLHDLIHASMPLGQGGSLSDETYANITAFILKANGAKAGTTAFSAATAPVRIGSIADGIRPTDLAARAALTRPPAGARARRPAMV